MTTSAVPFWLLGLLNNTSYVIMVASAKSISEGGTALVFLANVVPSLVLKLSAPYWFDFVSYDVRMAFGTGLMGLSFGIVGYFAGLADAVGGGKSEVGWELLGVGFGSLQTGLGEASLLALAGKFDARHTSSREDDGDDDEAAVPSVGDGAEGSAEVGDASTERDVVGEEGRADGKQKSEAGGGGGKGKGKCLAAFSSGTGLAGVFGFAFKVFFDDWLGVSLRGTLIAAQCLTISYWFVYRSWLGGGDHNDDTTSRTDGEEGRRTGSSSLLLVREEGGEDEPAEYDGGDGAPRRDRKTGKTRRKGRARYHGLRTDSDVATPSPSTGPPDGQTTTTTSSDSPLEVDGNYESLSSSSSSSSLSSVRVDDTVHVDTRTLSPIRKLKLVMSLWPYIIPLFVVYAAEYALQAGTWTAIGFPVTDEKKREEFYEYSNWTYQAGVFLSRSSGTIYQAPLSILWLMPFLQTINVIFFTIVASTHFWYDYTLLFPCFYVGLLGGAVYINGYTRICADLPLEIREFALSATSVGESLGIVAADLMGLILQGCLYESNGIDGSVVSCPF